MIQFSRAFFWHWRPSVQRIGMGLDIYLPGIKIRVGHDGPPCRICGSRAGIISWWPENPGAAICPGCCEHPDYEYEPGDRDYFCVECGDCAPYEWIDGLCGDDCCSVSMGASREPGEPIGTPISQLSGRPGHDGYEKFVEIAKSWGYD